MYFSFTWVVLVIMETVTNLQKYIHSSCKFEMYKFSPNKQASGEGSKKKLPETILEKEDRHPHLGDTGKCHSKMNSRL